MGQKNMHVNPATLSGIRKSVAGFTKLLESPRLGSIMSQNLFHNSFGMKITPHDVVREIIHFMKSSDQHDYKIIIGTDSARTSPSTADFVTAIVVHRVGNGGRYFWRRVEAKSVPTLRTRITHEALLSIEIAKEFLEIMKSVEMPKYDFEIHLDIGENGATKVLIQELVGMIRANDFEAKTKPDSYAASKVADRCL